MAEVTVVDAGDVEPRRNPETGLIVRPTLGLNAGLDLMEQAVLECPPGRSEEIAVGEIEETLFVTAGEGAIHLPDGTHPLGPEVAVYLPPRTRFVLEAGGSAPLRLVAVRLADPKPGPPSPPHVRPAADADAELGIAGRTYRILADPGSGLRSATHFLGTIPPGRAPDHFETSDEFIHVLEGEGLLHAGGAPRPVAAGSCIQLPARTLHSLENTGGGALRVVAVLRPAASPAAAFLPDGTRVT